MSDGPRFEHDCEQCVFLGTHGMRDLYVCDVKDGRSSVISREGSRGPDYASSLISIVERNQHYWEVDNPLVEALRRFRVTPQGQADLRRSAVITLLYNLGCAVGAGASAEVLTHTALNWALPPGMDYVSADEILDIKKALAILKE